MYDAKLSELIFLKISGQIIENSFWILNKLKYSNHLDTILKNL
jgi:hypothetical protein